MTVNGIPVEVEATLNGQPFDEDAHPYTECFPSGDTSTVVVTGWSVATLLRAAGTTPGQTRSVSVRRAVGGGSVVLGPSDYDDAAAGAPSFPEGPAVVEPRRRGPQLAAGYDFFRPTRAADCSADPNGPDRVSTPPGGVLSIAIASGTVLHVTAAADPDHVADGQSVGLSGEVQDPPADRPVAYRWTFTDGTTASGAAVTHRFPGPGTWSATLSASTGADAGGSSQPVTVVVGKVAGAPGNGDGTRATGTTGDPSASPTPSGGSSASPGARSSGAPGPAASSAPGPSASAASAQPTAGPGPSRPPAATAASVTPSPSAMLLPPGLLGLGLTPSLTGASAAPLAAPQVASPPTAIVGSVQGVLVASISNTPADPSAAAVEALRRALGPGGTRRPSPARPLAQVGALTLLGLCLAGGALAELRR